MHGKSIAWVRDRCRVESPAKRSALYAIATIGDKYTGATKASAATLARAAGCSSRHMQRMLPELVGDGLVEQLDAGAGRRPASYRINPALFVVEGDLTGTDIVEGALAGAGVVEGDVFAVTRSYDMASPLQGEPQPRSYDIGHPVATTSGSVATTRHGSEQHRCSTR
jgi:hypothetical protein